jgi:hypothetical protein
MANIKDLIKSISASETEFSKKLDSLQTMEETQRLEQAKIDKAMQDNVDLIVEAIRVMERKVQAQIEDAKAIIPAKGDQGPAGKDGRPGLDGKPGANGAAGQRGKDGVDGQDGVSVADARIDFDGSLIISLSTGQEINVGEVVAPDLAERIKVISTMSTNGAIGIKDEGSSISTGVKNINFVGATVTASASGDDVTVNVSAGTGTVTSVDVSGGTTGLTTSGGPITTTGSITLAGTLAVANGGTGVTTSTGTGSVVLSNSPTLVTPNLGTPSALVGTNITGTAGLNINGTVGATTPSTVAATTLTTSSTVTLNAGTANGVAYLDNGKIVRAEDDFTWDGGKLSIGASTGSDKLEVFDGNISVKSNSSSNGFRCVQSFAPNNSGNTLGFFGFDAIISGTRYKGASIESYSTAAWTTSSTPGYLSFRTTSVNSTNLTERVVIDSSGMTVTGALSASSGITLTNLTASSAVATDASKNLVSVANTGTGNNVLATSPTLVTPALGTPASGVVTNLTGTASININGTVGATTATTGAFTTLSATGVTTVQAGTAAAPAITTSGDTNTGIFFPAADTIAFAEGGVEAMRLDSSGNLGLGVTPSAWTIGKALQVSGASILSTGTEMYLSANAFFGASAWTYRQTDFAAQYYQLNGAHVWRTAPSGTAGAAITFTQAMTLNASGNLGIGTSSPATKLDVRGATTATIRVGSTGSGLSGDEFGNLEFYWADEDAPGVKAKIYTKNVGNVGPGGGGAADLLFATMPALGSLTERMRLDSSGNLLVGTTSQLYPASAARLNVDSGTNGTATFKTSGGSVQATLYSFNSATTGDNAFISFGTEATWTARGGITYNRAGGLVAYNVTSDYRAKDISGPVTGSGAVIDSVPVYMGKMKGATQERPMFIAHEVPAYAHTGEKDAVDAEGNPVFQQMDASALIPVMWAEIQSLRARLAAANI